MKLRKLFLEADADSSGQLSFAEFAYFLQYRFGVKPKPQVIKDILSVVDTDNDGNVDEEEFVSFFMVLVILESEIKFFI